MPRRVDFSSASPREIENLALNSALKHSLDNIHGTTLGTVKYILKNTKSVNMYKYTTLIEATVAKAVDDGKLIVDEAGWYTWPNHQHHYQLRREKLARQRLITARSAAFTTLPAAASGSQGNVDTSPTERLARKRKRRSKTTQREISSNDMLSSEPVSNTAHGSHSTHSNTYNVNGEPNRIKEARIIVAGSSGLMSNQADVALAGGSGLMLMSNQADVAVPGSSGLMKMTKQADAVATQVGPVANEGHKVDNKKKKRANKRKKSNSQNKEVPQSGAKKHNDARLHKGTQFKKN